MSNAPKWLKWVIKSVAKEQSVILHYEDVDRISESLSLLRWEFDGTNELICIDPPEELIKIINPTNANERIDIRLIIKALI